MDALSWLEENIIRMDLEEIFNTTKEPDWIWVNRSIFSDIFYGLGFEEDDESFVNDIDEESVFKLIEKTLYTKYVRINQFLFSSWEKSFKPTKDIHTVIFIKRNLHRRMSIDCQRAYGWVLKALAVDTYFKINSEYNSVKECYEELYCDNYRIIEELLSLKDYSYISGNWTYKPKDNVLLFYKKDKLMNSWTEQEAESFYQEIVPS